MLKTSGSVANREDLSSVITRVAPEKTPFLSTIGTQTAKNVRHEWQTEELDAVSTANKAVEGFTANAVAVAPTARLGNIAQLFSKTGSVSETQEASDHAGVSSELNRSKVNRGIALKRDKEATYLSGQASLLGDGTVARQAGGILSWIKTNVDLADDAVVGSHGYNTGTGLTADLTDAGTLRALDIDQFNNVQQLMFGNGATGKIAMMGRALKPKFSAFQGNAANRGSVSGKDQMTIYSGADVFVGDFGAITIVPHPYALENEVIIFDPEYVADATFRAINTVDLAKTGDNRSYLMTHEATLVVKNEKALGAIRAVQ